MRKRLFLLLSPILILGLFLWLIDHQLVPRVETFLKNKIETLLLTEENDSLRIQAAKISYFPPALTLHEIDLVSPSTSSLSQSLTASFPEVKFHLDYFALTMGRLQLSVISIHDPKIVFLNESKKPSDFFKNPLPINHFFKGLRQLPIQNLVIKNLDLNIKNVFPNSMTAASSFNLLITNKKEKIQLAAQISDAKIVDAKNDELLKFNSEVELTLSPNMISIDKVLVTTKGATIHAHGSQENPSYLFLQPNIQLKIGAQLDFQALSQNALKLLNLPFQATGNLNFDSQVTLKGLNQITGNASLSTQSVKIDQFTVGDASIKGSFTENALNLSEISLNHPSGQVLLTNTILKLKKGFPFQSQVQIQSLDLQKLFQSLDLKKIPVELGIAGELPCEGDFFENFDLTCSGKVLGKDFKVSSSTDPKKSSRILELRQFEAVGKFNVNAMGVDYQATVALPRSKIQTQGKILYTEGFEISYKSNGLNLKDIDYLSNISFSGSVAIEGNTIGDSYDATMQAKIKTQDFQIDKYFLGAFSTQLSFLSPRLIFKEIQGQLFNSKYISDLELDLRKENVQGHFESENFELIAVQKILKDLYDLPLSVGGTGPVKIIFHGPLDFWKLNYTAEAQFRSVLIENEYFERLKLKILGEDGNLLVEEAFLQKNKSSITTSGRVLNSKTFDLFFNGQGFQLEESQIINKLSPNIFGVFDFNSTIKGTLENPEFFFTGNVKNTILRDQSYEDSQFLIKSSPDESRFEISLFGKTLNSKMLRKTQSLPKLKISSNIESWDYTKLLSLLGNELLFDEYRGKLSLTSDLESEDGDINKLSGTLVVDQFSIGRMNEYIENKGPAKALFKKGKIGLDNFLLEGPNSRIVLTGDDFELKNLNISLKGKSDLKLTQLFLPFLDDIGGKFLLSVGVTGAWNHPEMLGNLMFEQAFFKINKFPHPLEKIDSAISFSQKNILINSIKGQIAGGTVKGDGSILLKEIGVIPTNLRLRLDNITLLVPDEIRSHGSADILITGDWFPFTISGSYYVKEGLITKNFDQETSSPEKTMAPKYLPKLLQKDNFDPLILDLKVLMPKNLAIKNANIDGNISGTLQVRGPPEAPQLQGKMSAEKNTKLTFRDRVFNINTAFVEFKNSLDMNPDVYLNAQSRIDEYDINLSVQGPVKNLQIQMTSTPPLAESEITTLLAFGVTSSKLDQSIASKTQTEKLGYEIGQYIYRSNPLLRKKIKDTLGVDVDIRTDFDSTTNTNVNKVTGSKKITEKISVRASRTLGGATTSYEAETTYRINSNLSVLGSWKNKEATETQNVQSNGTATTDLFGLDLEFKREFK